jgi:hypothetical protein
MKNAWLDWIYHKRSLGIQLIIHRIKEKEYRHYHWIMCKKKISKRDWKSSSAQTLYFFNCPKGIFKGTSAPLYPSISDFGTLYSWRSPLVITTVLPLSHPHFQHPDRLWILRSYEQWRPNKVLHLLPIVVNAINRIKYLTFV